MTTNSVANLYIQRDNVRTIRVSCMVFKKVFQGISKLQQREYLEYFSWIFIATIDDCLYFYSIKNSKNRIFFWKLIELRTWIYKIFGIFLMDFYSYKRQLLKFFEGSKKSQVCILGIFLKTRDENLVCKIFEIFLMHFYSHSRWLFKFFEGVKKVTDLDLLRFFWRRTETKS